MSRLNKYSTPLLGHSKLSSGSSNFLWENLPEGQQSLQQFTNLGFMGEWLDGSPS